MVLIGILARKRHGKDTCADYLVNAYGFHKMALADPLKESCRTLFDLSDEQLYGDLKEVVDERWGVTPRRILQYIGTNIFRYSMDELLPWVKDNFWLEKIRIKYEDFKKKYGDNVNVVISDLRFPNEVDFVHSIGGTVIKVYRPCICDDTETHSSEILIDEITSYEHLIVNDGTVEEYYKKIDQIVSS